MLFSDSLGHISMRWVEVHGPSVRVVFMPWLKFILGSVMGLVVPRPPNIQILSRMVLGSR